MNTQTHDITHEQAQEHRCSFNSHFVENGLAS